MNDSTTLPRIRIRGIPVNELMLKNRLALVKPYPSSAMGSTRSAA
jgi:hypothetical protein